MKSKIVTCAMCGYARAYVVGESPPLFLTLHLYYLGEIHCHMSFMCLTEVDSLF